MMVHCYAVLMVYIDSILRHLYIFSLRARSLVVVGERAVGRHTTGVATQRHRVTPASDVHRHAAIFEDVNILIKSSQQPK